jgi:hypothetical protein
MSGTGGLSASGSDANERNCEERMKIAQIRCQEATLANKPPVPPEVILRSNILLTENCAKRGYGLEAPVLTTG